jgi:uncharacterized membrane protein YphA (DoxX/SURF4 family)
VTEKLTTEDHVVTVLRCVLGVIFLWLGLLQLAGVNPAMPSLADSYPLFAVGGIGLLGLFAAVIGVLLLVNKFRRLTEVILIGYMLLVCGAFVVHAEHIFASQFLHLTTFGELLLKDITLAISGLLVLVHQGLNTA